MNVQHLERVLAEFQPFKQFKSRELAALAAASAPTRLTCSQVAACQRAIAAGDAFGKRIILK